MTAGLYAYFYKDWEEAIEKREIAAAAAPPSDPSAYYALARCYSSMDNPGKTLRYLEKTLNIEPTHEGARLELGNLNYFQGDVDNAISQYRELLVQLDGRNAKRASWNLGLAYMGKEAWDDAQMSVELQHSILGAWLALTQAGFPPASHQVISGPHVHPLVQCPAM